MYVRVPFLTETETRARARQSRIKYSSLSHHQRHSGPPDRIGWWPERSDAGDIFNRYYPSIRCDVRLMAIPFIDADPM